MVRMVHPTLVLVLLELVGVILALIVGWRRIGSFSSRFKAAFWFTVGATIVAYYSSSIAWMWQTPVKLNPQNKWRALDELFGAAPAVAGAPIVLVIAVLMLRAWTWSAHDRLIKDEVTERHRFFPK